MGRCFFVLFREGVIEKYIKAKKAYFKWKNRSTFAVEFEKHEKRIL